MAEQSPADSMSTTTRIQFRDAPFPKDHPFIRVILALLAKDADARTNAAVAHSFIEAMVDEVVRAKCKNGSKIVKDHRTYPHSAKLVLLHELGLLTDEQYRILDWFRDVRNKFAHGWDFQVKGERLAIFYDKWGDLYTQTENFPLLCAMIVLDYYGIFATVMGVPSMQGRRTRGVVRLAEYEAAPGA